MVLIFYQLYIYICFKIFIHAFTAFSDRFSRKFKYLITEHFLKKKTIKMFSPVLFKTANYNLHIHIIFQSLFNDIFPLKSSWFSEIGVNMFLKLNENKHVHPFNYFELNFWNLNFSSKITCFFAYLACILLIHHATYCIFHI